jgi:23S rRNA (cytidine1920-2'-O)/16S rRNA (cytidine1409-2'-O)-methyltransferase
MKERLDKVMVDRAVVQSRERAKSLIMQGKVLVNGVPAAKPGTPVSSEAVITLKDADTPYVSRGGLKLAAALDHFHIDPQGKTVLDIGCSTGGFTDCVLKRNAERVYAIDVGYGQFDWSLRNDNRVVLMEKTNFRYLDKGALPEPVDLAVIDVSFISLSKILEKALEFLAGNGDVLALIKPQFEVGRKMVGKGGIVRSEEDRLSAVSAVESFAASVGAVPIGIFECPVHGQKGNIEYFICLRRTPHG